MTDQIETYPSARPWTLADTHFDARCQDGCTMAFLQIPTAFKVGGNGVLQLMRIDMMDVLLFASHRGRPAVGMVSRRQRRRRILDAEIHEMVEDCTKHGARDFLLNLGWLGGLPTTQATVGVAEVLTLLPGVKRADADSWIDDHILRVLRPALTQARLAEIDDQRRIVKNQQETIDGLRQVNGRLERVIPTKH